MPYKMEIGQLNVDISEVKHKTILTKYHRHR